MLFPRAVRTAARGVARGPSAAAPRMSMRRLTQNSPPKHSKSYSSAGSHGHTPSSDMPWIIGAVAFTIPASWYLLSMGSPKPKHGDPHRPTDTASSSPGDNVQTEPAEHHGPLTHPQSGEKPYTSDAKESSSDDNEPDAATDDAQGSKDLKESVGAAHRDVSEAVEDARDQAREKTGEMGEKAGELYGEAKNKAETSVQGVTDKAASVKEKAGETFEGMTGEFKEKAEQATEKVKKTADKVDPRSRDLPDVDQAVAGDDTNRKGQALTSANPAKTDPADKGAGAGQRDVGSSNEQSGKQEGISNQDTWHAVLHDERGDALSKKSEGSHETAKVKGTVDVNRGAK